MSLSIVIPALNEENNLRELLPYIHSCRFNANYEIIVVDARRSDDNTEQVCKTYDTKYYKSTAAQRSIQMNEGARLAVNELLLFLHADVRPPKDFGYQIHTAIAEGNKMGLFAYRFDSDKLMLKINSYWTKFDGLFTGGGDQAHFMSKAFFEEMGGYREDITFMEDFDFWFRIKHLKVPYKLVKSRAIVSARKYEHNSWLRVNLVNLFLFLRFKYGKSPNEMRHIYKKYLNI